MKTIILNVEDLRNRAGQLRLLKSEYENCQLKLNRTMSHLEEVYKKEGIPLVVEEMNLSMSMQVMGEKLDKLANLLEARAWEIEHEGDD